MHEESPLSPYSIIVSGAAADGPETLLTSAGAVTWLSWCHPLREPNQDALAVVDLGEGDLVLAVADGMGGHAEGDVAARTALECLAQAVEAAHDRGDDLRVGILEGFESAQERVSALPGDGGTTLTALEITGGRARSIHTGDTAAWLVGGRGKRKFESMDHSPTAYAREAGLLEEEEARLHADRHILLSAIGHPDLRIEIGPRQRLAPRDTFLVASDGLTDNLPSSEILALARGTDTEAAGLALAQRARSVMESPDGKPDDLTVLLFRPGSEGEDSGEVG